MTSCFWTGSRLNLATFVTTWMEPEASRLMAEAFDKNMIDKDEYPQTAEIERRCVNMVAHLFNAPEDGESGGGGHAELRPADPRTGRT
jgi:glutamate decarboxylase